MDEAPHPGTGDPDGTGGPHVFVDDVDSPEIRDDDRHHLARVVRIRDGAAITVSDGRGRWRAARFGARVEVSGPVVHVPAPLDAITVGFALLKGSRIDDAVRHLTELGVDRIVPFTSERCVVRWDADDARRRRVRLERIVREAAMQCRRAWLPTVEPPTDFAALVSRDGSVVAQMGAPPLTDGARTILIGPEGGFTATELASAPGTCSLGDHVLRAETAVLTAGALLADRRRRRR